MVWVDALFIVAFVADDFFWPYIAIYKQPHEAMSVHIAFLLAFWAFWVIDTELSVSAPFASAFTLFPGTLDTTPPLPTATADSFYLGIEQLFFKIDLRQIHAQILRGGNTT